MQSDATPTKEGGLGFRQWHYVTASAKLSPTADLASICLDSGCTITLVDRAFLFKHYPNAQILRIVLPLTVRGIGNERHRTSEYINLDIYFPGKLGHNKATAHVTREAHIIKGLKANVLAGVNLLAAEAFVINLAKKTAIISSCKGIAIDLAVTPRSNERLQKSILLAESTVIPPHTRASVRVNYAGSLPQNRDMLFEPTHANFFAHVVDAQMFWIYANNATSVPIVISAKVKLGNLVECATDGYFLTLLTDANLALRGNQKLAARARLKKVLAHHTSISEELKLASGVTVYDSDPEAGRQIAAVADSYPELWVDNGNVADVTEEEWMKIPLINNWQDVYKPANAKVYLLEPRNREVVDAQFDKLHQQGRLKWSTEATPFSYPCFVVWKEVNGIKKGRVVVDIRTLNKITVPNVYPVPSQSDIINAVQGCRYISVVDYSSFFYQWRVYRVYRHRLAVVSHRGQEVFNVAVIGYRNLLAYVQRIIDKILRQERGFSRAYVDDIVIFSRTLEEHIRHLHQVFERLAHIGICLSPEKSFLAYPTIHLLGQRVDAFGLSTAENKLRAISTLRFPTTLLQLETYLGMTGYLRHYVDHFAFKANALEIRKAALNKVLRDKGAVSGSGRKRQALRLKIKLPSPFEKMAFEVLQKDFSKPSILVHYDSARILFYDIDWSKERGCGVAVFHLKCLPSTASPEQIAEAMKPCFKFKASDVEPIMFLSRMLTNAEQKYWPTEGELACMVWAIKKTRHLVEAVKYPVIIYTDHQANPSIAHNASMKTTSVEKFNLRLVRASEYLQRFDIQVRWKPGKQYFVPDALSRLPSDNIYESHLDSEYSELDCLHGDCTSYATNSNTCAINSNAYASNSACYYYYQATLIEMLPEFQARLKKGYKVNTRWRPILEKLRQNDALDKQAAALLYEEDHRHLYLVDSEDGRRRLCIPYNMVGEVFRIAHDEHEYAGFTRTYDRITASLCVYQLSRRLKQYIKYCQPCQKSQTRRYKPYNKLQPILTPGIPFHTVAMDFVLAMPVFNEGFDSVILITCKFSKRIGLIPGKSTYSAKDWAAVLLAYLLLTG